MLMMELWVMDERFNIIDFIDSFKSLIWTERYNQYGDFELYIPASTEMLRRIKKNYCLMLPESDEVMVVETIQITTDFEEGNFIIFSGRSLESILDRRIIWKQTILNSFLEYGVNRLLNENIIEPELSERKIDSFSYVSSGNVEIEQMKIRAQYTGDNLYDVIKEICESFEIGFQIKLNQNGMMMFSLYKGNDRTPYQEVVPFVIFSKEYENLIKSEYMESDKEIKNVALIAGEDVGGNRRTVSIGNDNGLKRRELYVDARDIQSETDDGELDEDVYNKLLIQRGNEKLADCKESAVFDTQVDSTKNFVYGKDYFKGDIVLIKNEYGIERKARITEVIRTEDSTGYTVYPTFSIEE